jgi:predicted DNA-binding transcriptional regulator AlpA
MLEQHLHVEPERGTRSPLSDESLITSKQLRELLGHCSEMHIWRLLNKEKYQPLAFPKPIKINDRNYWRLGGVRQWIRDREAQWQKVSPDNGGTELAPAGETLFGGQNRPHPVARGEPRVAHLGDARPHAALSASAAGIGASRKQSRASKRGRSRVRASPRRTA